MMGAQYPAKVSIWVRNQSNANLSIVDAYIHRLHLSIDHALAVSYRRNMYDGKTAFVAHVSLVKGVPFYGYHVGYTYFLKIYLLNPLHITRLADLLRQGSVMKANIQPFESHMQYIPQWMCDYNLYGCAYLDCSTVRFRSPLPKYLDTYSTAHLWHDRSIPASLISDEGKLPRQSHCSIEVDICTQNIINRLDIEARPLHHDFIERVKPLAPDEKLVHSMAGLWRDETRRRKARMGLTDPGSSPFPPEVLISVSANPRNSQPGGWIHEKEFFDKMAMIIAEERSNSDIREIRYESFVENSSMEKEVKTALESVEDFYPGNFPMSGALKQVHQVQKETENAIGNHDTEVDESRIMSWEDDDFPYDSDEELARELDRSQRKRADYGEDGQLDGDTTGNLYDQEARPGGAHFAQQFEDSLDPLAVTDLGGLNSSSELEKFGVRDAGDFSHVHEDAFEIPSNCASDISSAIAHHKRTLTEAHKANRLGKRRKLVHDERSFSVEEAENLSFGNVSNDFDKNDSDQQVFEAQGLGRVRDAAGKAATTYGKGDTQSRAQGNPVNRKSIAQETFKANGFSGNKTLSFPIVKDPQDPFTIQRLSQSSNSSVKGSQQSSGKSLPLDASAFTSSDTSTDHRSTLSKSLSETTSVPAFALNTSKQVHSAFGISSTTRVICISSIAPEASEISSMMRDNGVPSVIYQDAYYSDEKDVPERPREYAGKEFKLESDTVPYLPGFDPSGLGLPSLGAKSSMVLDKVTDEKFYQRCRRVCSLRCWEIAQPPPQRFEVEAWLRNNGNIVDSISSVPNGNSKTNRGLSQIDAPTQKNKHGFKYSQKQDSTSVQHETQYMSIMSLELHVNTRGKLSPDPEQDEIACVFWCLQSDDEDLEVNTAKESSHVGILVLTEDGTLGQRISQQTSADVEGETSELDLITRMVDIVRSYDPDIITGYEVHGGSWGYLIERARCKYDYDLCDEFSRMKSQSHGRFGRENDRWGFNQTSTIRVTGRHMINIWRAMRGELNLLQYTMENVAFHVLHRRIPHYSYKDLTSWYNSQKPRDLAKVINYYLSRVQVDLEILEQNELVPRTSEQARLLGVDFFSVFSRGSQFKVESLMFRIAKPENLLLVSPSRKQVGQQNALECLPLVMEPQSAFYNSPLLVLDFQSLYPSVMIAYNYCYSTFLGRVVSWRGQNKMGFTDYNREQRLLELLKDQINIAPNGIMYVKPAVRKSLLAKMLGEILETRVMVKSGMKADKDDKTLQRLLNNRQLALKLIANVTYGYTSASFSGRMPCSEIADSIVQTGRETLEKAIALIHSVERWGAEVVYGDTDSLFVYLKGRTKDEAFDVGNEIAAAVTDMNPRPVKLKFEKVYLPCVLLAKKRYVGFKYESKDQKEPDFDAKGIETVRRDGTPAEQKIEEQALKVLFKTADLSQVKEYFQKQCSKIMRGKVSIQDFCFAREVKLGTYSDKGPPPPGALISTRRMLEDPRAEPQYGERVPYVVITGAPGARLIDRCVAPNVLLHNEHNELDAEYYISKNIIPPLERIFNLMGANVRQWYDEMPKFQRIRRINGGSFSSTNDLVPLKKTLESYMKPSSCFVCRDKLEAEIPICSRCIQHPETSMLTLRYRLNKAESKVRGLKTICRSCSGLAWGEEVKCDSNDCAVFYSRTRHVTGLGNTRALTEPVMELLGEADLKALDW